MLQTPHTDNLYRPVHQITIHQKPIYQKQRTPRPNKTQTLTHLEQVETNLNRRIHKIRQEFLKKLSYHFSEIEKLGNNEKFGSDRVLDKFLHKLSYDLDNKVSRVEEAQEARIYSTRANIEDYPFLTQFRDDFDEIKKTEFSGAFFHNDWVDVEDSKKCELKEENEWRKIESENQKSKNQKSNKNQKSDENQKSEDVELFYEKFCMVVDESKIGTVNSVHSVNSGRILGKIKFFVNKAGYGIIEADVKPNQDYYFNVRNAVNQCFEKGQKVRGVIH